MIAEIAQDLVDKVSSVPALTGKVGTAIGGTNTDPLMLQAPVPFAFVVFGNDNVLDTQPDGRKYQLVRYNFMVGIHQEYATTSGWQATMMSTSFPLLEAVRAAVNGKFGPQANTNLRWEYNGQDLIYQDQGRQIYIQQYSLIALNTTT
jgi:hypothetical protein